RPPRLAGVGAGGAVHVVEALGRCVVRLEVVVGQRPRRRDAAVVLDLAEVAFAESEEDRAVELSLSPDVVMLSGVELLAVFVDPLLLRLVAAFGDDLTAVPVLELALDVVPTLEEEDPQSA